MKRKVSWRRPRPKNWAVEPQEKRNGVLEMTDFPDFFTVSYSEKKNETFRGLDLLPSSGEEYLHI
jgi:hypothetical protein